MLSLYFSSTATVMASVKLYIIGKMAIYIFEIITSFITFF